MIGCLAQSIVSLVRVVFGGERRNRRSVAIEGQLYLQRRPYFQKREDLLWREHVIRVQSTVAGDNKEPTGSMTMLSRTHSGSFRAEEQLHRHRRRLATGIWPSRTVESCHDWTDIHQYAANPSGWLAQNSSCTYASGVRRCPTVLRMALKGQANFLAPNGEVSQSRNSARDSGTSFPIVKPVAESGAGRATTKLIADKLVHN